MSDHRGGSPAYALRPPTSDEEDASGAKLVSPRSDVSTASTTEESGAVALVPAQSHQESTGNGQWGELATAPTLLITPREPANDDNAASTTRIATPPAMASDPAWFRSGNTVPPPSMRPPAESAPTLAEKRPPNPRVLKIVGGVIGACLFIVAVASVKILYQRAASAGTRAPTETTSAALPSNQAEPPAPAAEAIKAAEKPAPSEPSAPSAPAATAPPSSHAAPAHAPSPARITTKPAPRRAPVTKKVVRR